jgi:membrane protease YdiL (CAAX protease family)
MKFQPQLPPATQDRWNPKSVWIFSIILLFLCFTTILIFSLIFGAEYSTHPVRYLVGNIVVAAMMVLATWKYLRCRTFRELVYYLGLGSRPSKGTALFLLLGLLLGITALYCLRLAYGSTALGWFENIRPRSFLVLFGPMIEEPLFRGYFYPAFRVRYPVLKSIGLMLVIVAVTHSVNLFRNPVNLFFITSVHVLLCLLREYNSSLYPALFFHLGYNAAAAFN